MMAEEFFTKGLAFILEGDTEKVFYLSLLQYLAEKNDALFEMRFTPSGNDYFYVISKDDRNVIIKIKSVGTITQLVNSFSWFKNMCKSAYPGINWTVFLCYDTDSYNDDISEFFEGDWDKLRKDLVRLRNVSIDDFAASADIEDIMLLDIDGICAFMNQPSVPIPSGRKGKAKMKKLFKSFGKGIAYHEGDRAEPMIKCLDFDKIIQSAPFDLQKLQTVLFG